jgi:branched-chain amino acid transport system permease protein
MIRAGVDDPQMARVVGIPVPWLFTVVFALGAGLAGFAGMIGSPILSVYNFGQALLPELAYCVLFLPMVLILALRPQGMFGRQAP